MKSTVGVLGGIIALILFLWVGTTVGMGGIISLTTIGGAIAYLASDTDRRKRRKK